MTAGASFALHDDDDDDEISSPKLRGPSVRTLVGVVPCSVGLLTLFSKQRDGFELRKITSGVLWICVTVADSCLYSKLLCSGLCGLVFRETSPPHPPLPHSPHLWLNLVPCPWTTEQANSTVYFGLLLVLPDFMPFSSLNKSCSTDRRARVNERQETARAGRAHTIQAALW